MLRYMINALKKQSGARIFVTGLRGISLKAVFSISETAKFLPVVAEQV